MDRKKFLALLATTPFLFSSMKLRELEKISGKYSASNKTPLLFIGHGHPMNALLDNSFTQQLKVIGDSIERPNAILVVSAHWETKGTFVSTNANPQTIYDFGGFDDRLFQIKYNAPGHPSLAQETIKEGASFGLQSHDGMGFDHGAWTVLMHMFPKADIPVYQMSIDYTKGPAYHYQLAASLKKLREKGVLILSSGNIVHNLRILDWHNINATPFDWAVDFDTMVKTDLLKGDFNKLINYQNYGKLAQMAIPSNDHYLPLLYTLGLSDKSEQVEMIYEGIQYGSLSMRCLKIS